MLLLVSLTCHSWPGNARAKWLRAAAGAAMLEEPGSRSRLRKNTVAVHPPMSSNANGRAALLERQPWLTFLLPFGVYIVIGALEPAPGKCTICFGHSYPVAYAIKIALTLVAVGFVWPGYRQFSATGELVGDRGRPGRRAVVDSRWPCPAGSGCTYGRWSTKGPALGFPGRRRAAGVQSVRSPPDPGDRPGAWAFSRRALLRPRRRRCPLVEEFFLRGFVIAKL